MRQHSNQKMRTVYSLKPPVCASIQKGLPETRMPASNHQLPKRTLKDNLNIMPKHRIGVIGARAEGENTTRRVEIFSNRRSEPLWLSHPHACIFAVCLSYYCFMTKQFSFGFKIDVFKINLIASWSLI